MATISLREYICIILPPLSILPTWYFLLPIQGTGQRLLAESGPHGEHLMLVPVRNAAGHISLLPLNSLPEGLSGSSWRPRPNQTSLPHIQVSCWSKGNVILYHNNIVMHYGFVK